MVPVLVAAALLAAPPPAAPPGLTLRWEAPAGCPNEAAVRARVVRMTGEEAAQKVSLSAHGQVREDGPGRWALDLELTGETGGGRRSLTAGRCEELAEAAALVVAIAVDPRAALAAEPQPEPGEAGVVPLPPEPGVSLGTGESGGVVDVPKDMSKAAVPEEIEVPTQVSVRTGAKEPALSDSRGVEVRVRAGGGVSFARILPGPGAAVNLGVSLSGKRWRAELGGLYLPPVIGGDAQLGGRFQAGAVELRGCPVLRRGQVEVPLCVGLQVGAIEGQGRGTSLMATSKARSPWLAGTVGAAIGWRPRGRVGPWLQVDAIVALLRPEFVTAGGAPVHQAARFGGQVLAGIEVRLR